MWNQRSTPDFAYQNDQRNKIYTLGDFEKKTPTHMVATHAISKSQQNFQNRIPRELDKNFYIPRISMIYWISSNFLKLKNRPQKKVISIPNPGIQPTHYTFFLFHLYFLMNGMNALFALYECKIEWMVWNWFFLSWLKQVH